MTDYGTRRSISLPARESRIETVYAYLVAGGVQTVYEFPNTDGLMKKFYIKLNFKNFTAGRVMTVTVDLEDADGAWNLFDTVDYTCNTAGEPNPYIEIEHFRDVRVSCQIAVVEGGNVDIERDIDVWAME